MKKLLPVFFIFVAACSFGQTVPDFDHIKLVQASDYAAAEPFVLQTSRYLLSTPFQKNNTNRVKSIQFIVKWISGTPNYSFTLDDTAGKAAKGDGDLLGIYIAAMTKYSLENKAAAKDPKLVKLNALISLIDYCGNKDNNLKMTKQLKKLAEAREKGELEQLL